ncbi:MAG: ABC transporter ATP-binding protein [Alkaliphilus sp.]
MKNNEEMKAIKKQKSKINFAGMVMALSVAFGILATVLVMNIFREFTGEGESYNKVVVIATIICVLLIMKAVLYAIALWISHIAAYQSLSDIREQIIEHLKRMPLAFFQRRSSGELTKIINYDVEKIELLLAHALPDRFVVMSLTCIIFVSVMILDWRLGLTMIAFVPVIAIIMALISKWWGKIQLRHAKSLAEMSASLMEYIAGISVIKAFSGEETRSEMVKEKIKENIKWEEYQIKVTNIPIGFLSILVEGGLALVAITGSILLMSNQITADKFFIILILSIGFYGVISKLYFIAGTNVMYKSAIKNVNSILEEKPLELIAKEDFKLENYTISFDNVSFLFGETAVLKNVNLSFPQGSVTALVGKSGSGKSTLANLIMRFWLVNEGEITIDGVDIRAIKEENLSKCISMVQQDVFLFNTSVLENIRLGNCEATDEEIIEAAKKARIHDFAISLPNGYKTIVGEKGARLSGGEKQRISIARAILKKAPIVILDEATASIDPYNEKLIHEAISNLTKGKTLIVIAHHLNTIIKADQIVLLDKERPLAVGTHIELLNQEELYRQLWKEQEECKQWGLRA